jgi:hypothetical protein
MATRGNTPKTSASCPCKLVAAALDGVELAATVTVLVVTGFEVAVVAVGLEVVAPKLCPV